jgi:hypothetical protein
MRDHAMEIDAVSCAMMPSVSACGSLPKIRFPTTPPNAGVKNIVDVAIFYVSFSAFDTRKGICASMVSFNRF